MLNHFGASQAPTHARANARALFTVAVAWLSFLATVTLPYQSAAQSTPTCTGSTLDVAASGNPHNSGISCENVEDFSINLGDGVRIETETAPGISLSGTGRLAIRSLDRSEAVVSTSGDSNEGISVTMPFSPLPDPGSVSITVGDVQTTGEGSSAISASRITGDVSITSTGTISTSGDLSDGIFVTMPFNPEPGSVSIFRSRHIDNWRTVECNSGQSDQRRRLDNLDRDNKGFGTRFRRRLHRQHLASGRQREDADLGSRRHFNVRCRRSRPCGRQRSCRGRPEHRLDRDDINNDRLRLRNPRVPGIRRMTRPSVPLKLP